MIDDDDIVGVPGGLVKIVQDHDYAITLVDFNLYRLVPHKGLYVKGFGQAFSLTGAELMDLSWQRAGQHGVSQNA